MAYAEELAGRVRDIVAGRSGVTERKMFGGITWMIEWVDAGADLAASMPAK